MRDCPRAVFLALAVGLFGQFRRDVIEVFGGQSGDAEMAGSEIDADLACAAAVEGCDGGDVHGFTSHGTGSGSVKLRSAFATISETLRPFDVR